jgi:hypothetical protein
MFKLVGRIIDQTDGQSGVDKTASLSFNDYAVVIEDYEGKIGRKYPLGTMEDVEDSMEAFEKYASRIMPLHRRTAATFLSKACTKYSIPPTDKIAMYADDSINERTVAYKRAVADFEPGRMHKEASSLIQTISRLKEEPSLEYGVDESFVKQGAYELISMIEDTEALPKDNLVSAGLRKMAQDNVAIVAEDLYGVAKEVCKLAGIPITKTMFRDPVSWPKIGLTKVASEESLDEFILENLSKLDGHFNIELLEKIASNPTKTLISLPEEISKIVADLLTSNE